MCRVFFVGMLVFSSVFIFEAKKTTVVVKETIFKKQEDQDNEHLQSVDNRAFKEQFKALEPRAKQYYLMGLSVVAYESLLNRFSGDVEWRNYWQSMPKNKRIAVRSWSGQRNLIAELYYFLCSWSDGDLFTQEFRRLYHIVRPTFKKDLTYWKKRWLEINQGDPGRDKIANILFEVFKLEMLNIEHN